MTADLTELILDRAHNAAISLDEAGVVTYWNPSAERMFAIRREEAIGQPVAELIIPARFREAHHAGLRRFLSTGEGPALDRRIELAAIRSDGHELPVEMTITALRGEGGKWSFHAFVQDVTERVEGERERERLVEELRRALRGSERRFDAIVGSLADPVTIRDREHRFLYANRAALEHLGFESWEQLRDTPPDAIMRDYTVYGEDGREVAMDDIPSVRILRGEEAEPLLIRTVNRETGIERWNLLKAAPLLAEEGEVDATITIIEDVTEQRRSQLRAGFLAQAGAALASSLDYEQTLRNVAELAVPNIADWCAVDLFDADGDRRTVAVAHVDPARLQLAEELRGYVPDQLDPDQGLGLVLRTGEALLYPEISAEMLQAAAVDDRHLELLNSVGFHSALIVPMRLGASILGAMTLVSAESGRTIEGGDRELAEQIAARAAVAIENSRLYSERSVIARTLQQSLLPETLPDIPDFELASIYLPAVETSMVGGDFYDVWQVGESWIMIVGDVTGKGIEAASLTSLVRHTVRTASEFHSSPAQLLGFIDATLKRRSVLSVCTALCLRLGPDAVTLAVGGHPLPLYVTGTGVSELGAPGPLLGGFPDVAWRDVEIELEPGSMLIAYTDGVTDARGEEERFGLERLCGMLEGLRESSAEEVLGALAATLERFQGGVHSDDTAAIALHRLDRASTANGRQDGRRVAAREPVTPPRGEIDGKTDEIRD